MDWNHGDACALEDYQARVFEQFNHCIGLRASLYRQASRFSRHGFWQRRQRIAA
ncbi:hypothetical protein [Marinimicrobium sp. ARAG 43.8]|uniref:hypothetical protein n=1 Tax=Marinimicrobium sp. ARAG 43.8 TaxID=3418719 RepID=UPI003CE7271C